MQFNTDFSLFIYIFCVSFLWSFSPFNCASLLLTGNQPIRALVRCCVCTVLAMQSKMDPQKASHWICHVFGSFLSPTGNSSHCSASSHHH